MDGSPDLSSAVSRGWSDRRYARRDHRVTEPPSHRAIDHRAMTMSMSMSMTRPCLVFWCDNEYGAKRTPSSDQRDATLHCTHILAREGAMGDGAVGT